MITLVNFLDKLSVLSGGEPDASGHSQRGHMGVVAFPGTF